MFFANIIYRDECFSDDGPFCETIPDYAIESYIHYLNENKFPVLETRVCGRMTLNRILSLSRMGTIIRPFYTSIE